MRSRIGQAPLDTVVVLCETDKQLSEIRIIWETNDLAYRMYICWIRRRIIIYPALSDDPMNSRKDESIT